MTELLIKYGNISLTIEQQSPSTVPFMSVIVSTSGRLHDEFIRLLFLQTHRETDRFFAGSGVQVVHFDRGFFHFRRTAFSSILKSRVSSILDKAVVLRINLNLDGAPIASKWNLSRGI